jgi:glycosyltransferase involved in cell wall biosynthesis
MKDPEFSVVIPTFNRAKFVVKAVESVLHQVLKAKEIIVVDDGSVDQTRAVLEPYRDKIHYIFQQNSGASAARNTGIRAANGAWLAFLDSDDEWTPEYLLKQVQWATQAPTEICMQSTNCRVHRAGRRYEKLL